jgi:hypothetical protein
VPDRRRSGTSGHGLVVGPPLVLRTALALAERQRRRLTQLHEQDWRIRRLVLLARFREHGFHSYPPFRGFCGTAVVVRRHRSRSGLVRYVITTEPSGRGVGKDVDGKSHTWPSHPSLLAATLDSGTDTPLGTGRGRS